MCCMALASLLCFARDTSVLRGIVPVKAVPTVLLDGKKQLSVMLAPVGQMPDVRSCCLC